MSVLELDSESNRDLIGTKPTAASARTAAACLGEKPFFLPVSSSTSTPKTNSYVERFLPYRLSEDLRLVKHT